MTDMIDTSRLPGLRGAAFAFPVAAAPVGVDVCRSGYRISPKQILFSI